MGRERSARLALRERPGRKVLARELSVRRDRPEQLAPRVAQERSARREPKAPRGLWVLRVRPEEAQPGRRAQRGPLARRALPVRQVLRVPPELRLRAPRVRQVLLAPRALRELPAPRVPRERKGRPEAKVQQARWAQLARQ